MARNSGLPKQNINTWRFWIWENKLLNHLKLFDLISHQSDIDKIYLYVKDPNERKYQLLINRLYQLLIYKLENAGLENSNDFKAYIENSNDMGDIYKNFEQHNPNKKCKILIVFDDVIAEVLCSKKT